MTRGKLKGRSKSRDSQKSWKCYKYHQPGHLKRNCPLLRKEKGKGFSKGDGTSGSGAHSSEDSGDDLLVVLDGTTCWGTPLAFPEILGPATRGLVDFRWLITPVQDKTRLQKISGHASQGSYLLKPSKTVSNCFQT